MQIYLGDYLNKNIRDKCQKFNIGRILVTNWPEFYENEPWAFDNGAWNYYKKGKTFNERSFFNRIEKAIRLYNYPDFAVMPDIVAGGLFSLDFSLSFLNKVPKEWNWYLAVQDRMTINDVESILHYFSGIFLGGSDEFKFQCRAFCNLAHKHNKKFHFGRCGTKPKILTAKIINTDSIDSSTPLFSFNILNKF